VKFLVLGAGKMGYAVAYDLIRSPRVETVFLADNQTETLATACERLADDKIVPVQMDATRFEEVTKIMSGCTVAISCIPYKDNYELAKAALEAAVNFVDLGGNEETVQKEFLLDEFARERGIAIIPDCGLAPGLVSILAAASAERMEQLYEMRLRVGGLPIEPQPPLNYLQVFSIEGLINQYVEDATIVQHGKAIKVPSLGDLEKIEFPAPFGELEAFTTSGGISTLPSTFGEKVQYLDYKTIRYPGHCDQIRLLRDLGLLDSQPVALDGSSVRPRELMSHLLGEKLPRDEMDVVLLRVTVTGLREGKPTQIVWECIDYMDQAAGLSAMMRMTAFPASILAQLLARGDIQEKGVLVQEKSVPTRLFLAELGGRGVRLSMTEKSPDA